MFTGIVEEVGLVESIRKGAKSAVITIKAHVIFDDLGLGDSVAVNGVCLTAAGLTGHTFLADVMHQTLNNSSLGDLKVGSHVNLERAMAINSRFGGHMVSGHIDGTGQILNIEQDDNAIWYTIKAESDIMKYIIQKGSIAIDGISLTIADLSVESFRVSIIPHTMKSTTLLERSVGDRVNLENDMVGKYIEKLIDPRYLPQKESKITKEFLQQYGY